MFAFQLGKTAKTPTTKTGKPDAKTEPPPVEPKPEPKPEPRPDAPTSPDLISPFKKK